MCSSDLSSLLGSDDDHSVHGPCPVEGRSGSILEDLEALDIVGIESRYGGTYESFHVPRGEVTTSNRPSGLLAQSAWD